MCHAEDQGKEIKNLLLQRYQSLDNRFSPVGLKVGTYDTPVNFNESLRVPIHRWYGYKEGFSPSFVHGFISSYAGDKKPVVFDPFGGVGTTALEANIMGYDAFLMDVNPLGLLASKVKTSHYSSQDIEQIKATYSSLQSKDSYPITTTVSNPTVARYFDELTWQSLLQVRSFVFDITADSVRDLFLLALLSLIDEISTHHKNGNGVKKKIKIKIPDELDFDGLKNKLLKKIDLFIDDIRNVRLKGESSIFNQSNLIDFQLPKSVDIVLTSPPYANCFDYSKVYLSELWLGGFFSTKEDQKNFRENSLISHVHYKWSPRNEDYCSEIITNMVVPILETKQLWSKNIIPMLKGYFSDMGRFFVNLSKNLNSNAVVGIVVGNSVYGGTPIATDIILADQAEQLGFKCEKIQVYRKVIASSQQMVLLSEKEKEFVRESLIVLKWK